jgi:hypothetical protein
VGEVPAQRIRKVHSDLPKSNRRKRRGVPRDEKVRFGSILLDHWTAIERERASTRLARFRFSDAGDCSRAIAYAALAVPESDPIEESGIFITTQGTTVHEQLQEALVRRYETDPGIHVECEVEVVDGDRGGHVDIVVYVAEPAWTTAIEAKTVGGARFRQAIGAPPRNTTALGPSYDHVIQGALGAKAVDADEMVVLYLSREAISHGIANDKGYSEVDRVVAEWTYDRPTYERVAAAEIARIEGILALVDDGELPRRIIPSPELPPRHLFIEPLTGGYVEYDKDWEPVAHNTFWRCDYCRYQSVCALTPAERTPISTVEVALGFPPGTFPGDEEKS